MLKATLPNGQIVKRGDPVLVEDGGLISTAIVDKIEESDGYPYVKVVIFNQTRNTLDASQKNPVVKAGGPGYRHIDTPANIKGVRFCLVDDAEEARLRAHHKQHGATGGTGDETQSPNPSEIPFEPTGTGEGKEGETGGDPTGGGDVGGQGGGKETGAGDFTGAPDDRTEFHPADTNKDGLIDREEKKAWNKKNPDNPVEKS